MVSDDNNDDDDDYDDDDDDGDANDNNDIVRGGDHDHRHCRHQTDSGAEGYER